MNCNLGGDVFPKHIYCMCKNFACTFMTLDEKKVTQFKQEINCLTSVPSCENTNMKSTFKLILCTTYALYCAVVEPGCDVMGVGKMLLESAFSFVKTDACLMRPTGKPKSLNDDYKQVF